jgi:hypothetical protein
MKILIRKIRWYSWEKSLEDKENGGNNLRK